MPVGVKERETPPQQQDRMPGIEWQMEPEPQYEDESWQPRGDLEGRVAVVTGGDSGIGRAVAVLFAKEGADIAIAYLDEHEDAETTARRVRELGRRCVTVPGDLADERHAEDLPRRVMEEFGRLDLLVNNESVQYSHESLADTPVAEIHDTIDSNVFGNIMVTRACLPHLKQGSAIIISTSVTAFRGSGHLAVYSATKGALLSLTRSLAQELVTKGIRVNGVAPGPVWTPLIPASFSPEEVKEFGRKAPMGRAAQPYEIAPSYLFLACDKYSGFISGQVIHPNGGEVVNA